jgi:hypothetical protein
MNHLGKTIVSTALLFASTILAATNVSVLGSTPYNNQRECVKECIWHVGVDDDLIIALGCSPPWVNECYCRTDLAVTASSFLTSCVASRCTEPATGVDIGLAVSVYDGYCSSAETPNPNVAAATTTAMTQASGMGPVSITRTSTYFVADTTLGTVLTSATMVAGSMQTASPDGSSGKPVHQLPVQAISEG